jgi:hypothetical protein
MGARLRMMVFLSTSAFWAWDPCAPVKIRMLAIINCFIIERPCIRIKQKTRQQLSGC